MADFVLERVRKAAEECESLKEFVTSARLVGELTHILGSFLLRERLSVENKKVTKLGINLFSTP